MAARFWHELTTREIEALDGTGAIAVLPVAAVEQHGPHLPLATDTIIVDGLVDELVRRASDAPPVLVLPTQAIGHSLEHERYAGTLSVSAETLLAAWLDIARGVARAGTRKLVLLNSHGGQRSLVDLAAVRLRAELGMLAVRASYFALGLPDGLFDADELANGIHGGEVETSLIMHLRPDLVRDAERRDFGGLAGAMRERYTWLGPERPVGFGWMSQDLDPSGVCGNAARADAERGRQLLEHLGAALAELVDEVARTPLDIVGGHESGP